MAVTVIKVPAAPVRLRWMTVSLNDFERTATSVLVQVDAKGEQIKGGIQIPGRLSAERYDAALAAFRDLMDASLLQQFIADGQIDPGSEVEIVAK
jgi:hypothetical protein